MDFNYSNEQLALQETLQRFIGRDYGFERRRELARSPLGFSAEAWAQYADLGLLSLPFPEEFGGLGGNAVDIMLVMELVGRGLLLEPFLSTIVMCGGLIRDAASEPLKRTMLPRIGAGELKLALACYEAAGRYELSRVACTAVSGAPREGLAVVERAVDRGIAALCAEAVGIITALNEATLNYLKTRKQFGVPIGNFQALQHRMADMFIAAEQARSMAVIAAVYADSDDPAERRRAVSGAKAYIGQAARLVGQQAVQMHGAMGVVDDLIVSHYFKRLTMISSSLGDVDFHLARFSNMLA